MADRSTGGHDLESGGERSYKGEVTDVNGIGSQAFEALSIQTCSFEALDLESHVLKFLTVQFAFNTSHVNGENVAACTTALRPSDEGTRPNLGRFVDVSGSCRSSLQRG